MSNHTHHHEENEPSKWKHEGVRVVASNQLDGNVPSTPGMDRKAAINFARVGAEKLWAGTVTIHANAKTGAHHHGPLESVIYVIKGRARMRWGDKLKSDPFYSPNLSLDHSDYRISFQRRVV